MLRHKPIEDLYNQDVNAKVEDSINELYNNPSSLYITSNNTISNLVSSQQISWDTYFSNIALLASLRSKDLSTKVGAIIVSSDNKILSTGYNGFIKGIDESQLPTSKTSPLPHETKYPYTVHAEANAICNITLNASIKNAKIYTTLFPCNECTKLLLQSGISEIIYISDKYHDQSSYIASRKMLDLLHVPYRQYNGPILVSV